MNLVSKLSSKKILSIAYPKEITKRSMGKAQKNLLKNFSTYIAYIAGAIIRHFKNSSMLAGSEIVNKFTLSSNMLILRSVNII